MLNGKFLTNKIIRQIIVGIVFFLLVAVLFAGLKDSDVPKQLETILMRKVLVRRHWEKHNMYKVSGI